MKTHDEIATLLGGFVDAAPEEQGTIMQGVLTEFDTAANEARAFTEGVPDGYANWKEAYAGLRKDYVKSFLSASNDTPKGERPPENEDSCPTVEEAAKAFVNKMFGRGD